MKIANFLNFKNRKQQRKDGKLSGLDFGMFMFNYVVGFGFIATIASVIDLGPWGLLVFLLTAFIATAVALSFSRLSQEFPNETGSSYSYAKKAFGKFGIFFQGWNQFAQIPLFASTSPLFIAEILASFDPNNKTIYTIISVTFFVLLTLVSTFGLKTSKIIIFITGVMKWLTIFIGFILIIFLAIKDNHFSESFNTEIKNADKSINASLIASTTVVFMYSFGGIEGAASMSGETKTTKFKNILMYSFGAILIFYILFYIIFLGVNVSAIPSKQTEGGELIGRIFKYVMGITGFIIFSIGMFFNRITSTLSTLLYYRRLITPLAEDGYLPAILNKKAKNDEYKIAIWFSSIVEMISMIIFTIIPEVTGEKNFFKSVLEIGTLAFFIQYFGTIVTGLVLHFQKRIKPIPIWEQIIYIISLILIVIILLFAFVPPVVNNPWEQKNTIAILPYLIVFIIGYIIWFLNWIYEKKKKEKINQN